MLNYKPIFSKLERHEAFAQLPISAAGLIRLKRQKGRQHGKRWRTKLVARTHVNGPGFNCQSLAQFVARQAASKWSHKGHGALWANKLRGFKAERALSLSSCGSTVAWGATVNGASWPRCLFEYLYLFFGPHTDTNKVKAIMCDSCLSCRLR